MSNESAAKLAQFVAEDVPTRHYADVLIERAEAARKGKAADDASGNAYNVAFNRAEVVIEHHHLEDWKPLHVGVQDFIDAVDRRRRQLKQPD